MSQQTQNTEAPIDVFISFALEDGFYADELIKHLRPLERSSAIKIWSKDKVPLGADIEATLQSYLANAQLILLLISADFIVSDLTYTHITQALKRLEAGKAQVIPVIVRPTSLWKEIFGSFQVLPRNGNPIAEWRNRDSAWVEVVESVRLIREQILVDRWRTEIVEEEEEEYVSRGVDPVPQEKGKQAEAPEVSKAMQPPVEYYFLDDSPWTGTIIRQPIVHFSEVFVKSGIPRETFVKAQNFKKLKHAIATKGRGVVVEGPSGIGKTSAVRKAMEELGIKEESYLSARNQQHLERIQTLESWHQGTVIIDDFHRLAESTRQRVVDYIKYLADTQPDAKKVVIIGIPHTHQKLVSLSYDLATRIDVFNFTRVDHETIRQMIEQGERALNIRFDRKAEIVRAAWGSLNVAQYICWHICVDQDVEYTASEAHMVRCHVNTAINEVIEELAMKFGPTLRYFAELGGQKNGLTLRLLEELAQCEDGFLSLPTLKSKRSDLASGITRFINERWIETFYQKHPDNSLQLFFDPISSALVVDDPQLLFYLNYFARTGMSQLAREVGKAASLAQRKVFISYSHHDTQWLKRLQVHLKPLEHEGIIDQWDDTRLAAGAIWQEKIQEALETSRVALLLVSADFLASSFIIEHELPTLLARAASGGTRIMCIILSPSSFRKSPLNIFQTINPPSQPLTSLDYNGQEQYFAQAADQVSDYLENDEA